MKARREEIRKEEREGNKREMNMMGGGGASKNDWARAVLWDTPRPAGVQCHRAECGPSRGGNPRVIDATAFVFPPISSKVTS